MPHLHLLYEKAVSITVSFFFFFCFSVLFLKVERHGNKLSASFGGFFGFNTEEVTFVLVSILAWWYRCFLLSNFLLIQIIPCQPSTNTAVPMVWRALQTDFQNNDDKSVHYYLCKFIPGMPLSLKVKKNLS